MRVVVHHPKRTEPDGTEVPASRAAFRVGRIEDFTNPITGKTTSKEEVAKALVAAAQEEHPGHWIDVEYLVHNGDAEVENPYGDGGTSTWVPSDKVPEGAISPKGSAINHEHVVIATQRQATT